MKYKINDFNHAVLGNLENDIVANRLKEISSCSVPKKGGLLVQIIMQYS